MNLTFIHFTRSAAIAAVLCMSAFHVFAQAAGKDWQALMDQHADAMKQGQYENGLNLAQKALALAETRLGPVHVEVALSLRMLVNTYSTLAQYEKALSAQQRVLAIRETIFGPEHPDTAEALQDLAFT